MSISVRSVLVSDPVDPSCAELLARHGIPVTSRHKLSKEELIQELQKHDGLIVRSETKLTADVFASCPNLRVVGRAGTGVDNIDLQAATRGGVLVLNTPGGNSVSACELTCAMISALARNVAQAAQALREGRWERSLYRGTELSGKTLAVLGMGRIGREVARRMQAFGMRVVAFDPLLTDQAAAELDARSLPLEQIWPIADYVTVHTPLIPQTRNLIDAAALAKCKKGVRVINVARGGIVDEEALLAALQSGRCAGAALDVFLEEPPTGPVARQLIAHPKVLATPHLGASTEEAQQRVAVEIAQQFLVLAGKSREHEITGAVNGPLVAAAASPATAAWLELSRRLGELAGRFADRETAAPVRATTIGSAAMRDSPFVRSGVLLGILSSGSRPTAGRANLINAAILAQEMGIEVEADYEAAENDAVAVEVAGHRIEGTVRGNAPLLLSLDDATFASGIALGDHRVSLYRASKVQQVARIVNAFSAKAIDVRSLTVNGSWTIVETERDAAVAVDGIEAF